MASKSAERFKERGGNNVTDRDTTGRPHYAEMCRNRRNRLRCKSDSVYNNATLLVFGNCCCLPRTTHIKTETSWWKDVSHPWKFVRRGDIQWRTETIPRNSRCGCRNVNKSANTDCNLMNWRRLLVTVTSYVFLFAVIFSIITSWPVWNSWRSSTSAESGLRRPRRRDHCRRCRRQWWRRRQRQERLGWRQRAVRRPRCVVCPTRTS